MERPPAVGELLRVRGALVYVGAPGRISDRIGGVKAPDVHELVELGQVEADPDLLQNLAQPFVEGVSVLLQGQRGADGTQVPVGTGDEPGSGSCDCAVMPESPFLQRGVRKAFTSVWERSSPDQPAR